MRLDRHWIASILPVWLGAVALSATAQTKGPPARTDQVAAAPDTVGALAGLEECHPRAGLPNFFAKLEAGKPVVIAYLGGSITSQPGWRVHSRKFFQEQYPKAKIEEIHAAIGGTGSDLGVCRLERDVLGGKPDLLFVEFCVNDGGLQREEARRTVEGIVRKTWKQDPTTDICFVYTTTAGRLKNLQAGKLANPTLGMEDVADHYGIPTIHFGLEVARLDQIGRLTVKGPLPDQMDDLAGPDGKVVFSRDGVHPHVETGHMLYLASIERSTPAIKKAGGKPGPHALPAPLEARNWEEARMVSLDAATLSDGWTEVDYSDPGLHPKIKRFTERMPKLWKAMKAGESISFRFKGTAAGVYALRGPDIGKISVVVDGGEPNVINPFDPHCHYYRIKYMIVAKDLEDKPHDVKITLLDEPIDKAAILARRKKTLDDPADNDKLGQYISDLMLVGTLVK